MGRMQGVVAAFIISAVFLGTVVANPEVVDANRRQNDGVVIIPPNCDRVLERDTGCITSPNWPRKSVDFTECQIKIIVGFNKRLKLTFNNFTLEGTDVCDHVNNYVQIRDVQSNRQVQYCGTFHPFTWLSDSNEVTVIMNAISSKVFNRFNATYYTVDEPIGGCNRVFTESSGVYSSSTRPASPYGNLDKCEVVIQARPDERVLVTLIHLDIPNCQRSLKIKDLLTKRTDEICGEHDKITWTSDSNQLIIIYTEGYDINVDLKYEVIRRPVNESCSGLVVGFPPDGILIETPNFPHPYPSNTECQVILHTSFDHVISLVVLEFVVQPPKETPYGEVCSDFTQFRDLSTSIQRRLCGSYHNFSFSTEGNEVMIGFKSDDLLDYIGGKILATSYPRLPAPDCMNLIRQDDSSFVLTSLNFPSDYPRDASCVIHLQDNPNYYIVFNFQEFDLEDSEECEADYIQFKSGTSGLFSTKLCGHKEQFSVTTDSNEIFLHFQTDDRNQKSGFKAICTILERPIRTPENTECSKWLSEKSGRIQLPVNPNWPPTEGSDCLIVIHAEPSERIRLKFVSFAVSDLEADKDYVEIYDIVDGHTGKGIYTGHLSPFSWTSFSNELAIFIRDENEITSVSFIVDYQTLPRSDDGCEVLLLEKSGSVEWPFNSHRQASHCNVVIRSSPHQQILLTFHTLTMEKALCSEHSMTIQDVTTQRQDKFCSTLWEFSWLSESNEVDIDFRRQSKAFVEVKATYQFIPRPKVSVFNQFLTSKQGTVSSLEHNRDEIVGKNCTIYIQTQPENSVLISLTDFLIGEKQDKNHQTLSCTGQQFLEVKDMTTGRTNVFCGEFDLFTWTSDQNLVSITFRISTYPTYNVFRAAYTSLPRLEGCDHRITAPYGIILSPNFPLPYSTNTECRYIIHSEPGNLVSLNFTSFDVEPCGQDVVEVKDLSTGRVQTFCGSHSLFSWTSDANEISIILRTGKKSIGAVGFKTSYQHIERPLVSECYVRLNEITDIEIPNFTVKDAKHVECIFYIYTNPLNRIQLTVDEFDEVFNCSDSGIEISDVATQTKNTYCAISHAFSWTADTNELKLRVFASKDQLPHMAAHWKPVSRLGVPVLWDAESADFYLDGTKSYQVVIRTLPNYRLVVNYLHEHEDEHDCETEGIHIKDSTTLRWFTDCEFFDGIMSWISDSNEIIAEVLPDEHGSKIEYISVLKAPPSECNKVLVSDLGGSNDLETTNYPAIYRNDDECDLIIQTKSNSRIQVVFETFWLEKATTMGCLHDFLNVTDTSTGFVYDHSERICSRHEAFSWTSEGNSLLLRLHTDDSIAHSGYHAKYTVLKRPIHTNYCNKTFLGPSGILQSPNIAQRLPVYENNQLCFYFLKGKVGENIVIDFKSFDVELQTPCERDYVKIEDVATGKTTIICGQHQELIWESESNEVNVTFVTDDIHAFNGFNATYKMHTLSRVSYCDVTLFDQTGTFQSPKFPAKYPNDLDCEYTIIVDSNHIVEITFEYFDIEDSPHCTNDFVELSSTGEGTNRHYCGQKEIFKWNSTTNHATVKLHSDHIVTKSGFLATYRTHQLQIQSANCSQTLTSTSGMISTPLYPSSYDNNLDCVYTITLDPNQQRVVRLDFLDFELEPPRLNFCSDFVQIAYTLNDIKLCGHLDQHIYVTGSHVVIHFHSDGSNTYRGFKLLYTSVIPPKRAPTIVTSTQPPYCDLDAGKLTEDYGIVHSPNFPLYYPNNELCRTVIETTKNTHIVITIRFMDIEDYKLCEWDSLQIFDDVTGRNSEALCGSLDAPLIWVSDSNRVKLIFKSDEILSRTGYYGTYSAIENIEPTPVGINKNPKPVKEKPKKPVLSAPPEKPQSNNKDFGCLPGFGNFIC